MFLPLHDGVPLRYLHAPIVTRALIGASTIAYLILALGLLPIGEQWVVAGLGVVPAVLFGTEALPEGLPFVPEPLTLVTSLFVHGSFLHLAGNMLLRFLAFYLLCGAGAGLSHAWLMPESQRPLIGASGAVAGVVAAYLILYPRVKVWGLFLKGIPLYMPASWAIGFWILLQLAAAFLGGDENIGWFAHLGGIAAGAVIVLVLRRRFDPVLARAEAEQQRAVT